MSGRLNNTIEGMLLNNLDAQACRLGLLLSEGNTLTMYMAMVVPIVALLLGLMLMRIMTVIVSIVTMCMTIMIMVMSIVIVCMGIMIMRVVMSIATMMFVRVCLLFVSVVVSLFCTTGSHAQCCAQASQRP